MICLICRQVETVAGLTTIHFEREEMRFVVNQVPARVCPSCGESYVDASVAMWLLQAAAALSAAGEADAVIEYNG